MNKTYNLLGCATRLLKMNLQRWVQLWALVGSVGDNKANGHFLGVSSWVVGGLFDPFFVAMEGLTLT